jgi:UDP-N-acetylmuramate dehydrogenase
MLGRIAGAVRFKEPLSFHTSLRIGGPAEFFIMPQDLDDVRYALAFAEQEGLPVILLGAGNDVLVSDRGVQAVVLKLQGAFSRAEFQGSEAAVGAGMSLSGLIRDAAAHDLGGIECLAGIPASIGGALATNAGTSEGSIIDFCSAVYFLHPDGTLGEFRPFARTISGQALDFPADSIFVGCRLQLVRRPADKIHKDIQQRLKQRHAAKPLALAAAGYVWKDPLDDSAARLVAASGLRGKRVNGAEICAKACNLIVNRGGASHGDILALMELTQERVETQFGITLRPEIRLLGLSAPAAFEAEPLAEPAGAR